MAAPVKTTREPVQAVKLRAWCECGGQFRHTDGLMFGVAIGSRRSLHACDKCGRKEWLDREYPCITHEPMKP